MLACLALAFGTNRAAWAAADSKAAAPRVHVGVYLKQIHRISLKDSQAVVDFHLWFRWTDDRLKPLQTFELVNGRVESKSEVYESTVGGNHYASCRVLATLHKVWDIARYPLDRHTLTIEIEDNDLEAEKLVYLPDIENSGLSETAEVAGWTLHQGSAYVVKHTDRTNYGDVSLPTGHQSHWSRFVFSVQFVRPGIGIFIKLITGLFIATAIALQGLRVPPMVVEARLALSVGAIFAAVASQYLVAAGLPESNGLTLADRIHILSFVFIFMAITESIVAYKLVLLGNAALAARLDRICFLGLVAGYVAIATALIAW